MAVAGFQLIEKLPWPGLSRMTVKNRRNHEKWPGNDDSGPFDDEYVSSCTA